MTDGRWQMAHPAPASKPSSKAAENFHDGLELRPRVEVGVGPDGEEASVVDLFERAQVFLPVERAGRQSGAAVGEAARGPSSARRGMCVRVGNPGAERTRGTDRI